MKKLLLLLLVALSTVAPRVYAQPPPDGTAMIHALGPHMFVILYIDRLCRLPLRDRDTWRFAAMVGMPGRGFGCWHFGADTTTAYKGKVVRIRQALVVVRAYTNSGLESQTWPIIPGWWQITRIRSNKATSTKWPVGLKLLIAPRPLFGNLNR